MADLKGARRATKVVVVGLAFLLLSACGSSPSGLAGTSCGSGPYFSFLPVAPVDIGLISAFGGLGAPGHTLPTAHAGFLLSTEGASVYSPGEIQIVQVRRDTYLVSPNRQGERDYAINFDVCEDVDGWFGHLTSLSPSIPEEPAGSCVTRNSGFETVETCTRNVSGIRLAPGDPLGTGGLSIELGLMGLDFGLLDRRVRNFYANPSRHPTPTFRAICAWLQFDSGNRAVLFSLLRDPARPFEVPSGEPRCGTMEVDELGTAKGVWAETGVTGMLAGDERRYLTLANYPYRPVERLALSLGPQELGARVATVPRETGGRVNRAFEDVANDGLLYCYNATVETDYRQDESWFVSLSPAGVLSVEWIEHAAAPSPCDDGPATWQLGPGALTFVR